MSLEFLHDARSTKEDVKLHNANGRRSIIVVRNRVHSDNPSAVFKYNPDDPVTQRAYRDAQSSNATTVQKGLCSGYGVVPYDYAEDSKEFSDGDDVVSRTYDGVMLELSDFQHFNSGEVTTKITVLDDGGLHIDISFEKPLLRHSSDDDGYEKKFDLNNEIVEGNVTVSGVPLDTAVEIMSPRNETFWQHGRNNVVNIVIPSD